MQKFLISKYIEIDAAHRIPEHQSKCRSLHGHRYKIETICIGQLAAEGAQAGMAGGMDFGFVKEFMVKIIDEPCDHGLILSVYDPIATELFKDDPDDDGALDVIKKAVNQYGYARADHKLVGKIYLLPDPPTAEVLARHWYNRLWKTMPAILHQVKVWETPTCYAIYPCK